MPARKAGWPSPLRRNPPLLTNRGRSPAAAATAPALTASRGDQHVARMMAWAQGRDNRLKPKVNGTTEPTSERRLSPAVRPGHNPCVIPPANMAAQAKAGLNGSMRSPYRSTATIARPMPIALITAMVGWYASWPSRSTAVISRLAEVTSSQATVNSGVKRNARKITPDAAAAASSSQNSDGAKIAQAREKTRKPAAATLTRAASCSGVWIATRMRVSGFGGFSMPGNGE